jgi:hypothetical protein
MQTIPSAAPISIRLLRASARVTAAAEILAVAVIAALLQSRLRLTADLAGWSGGAGPGRGPAGRRTA